MPLYTELLARMMTILAFFVSLIVRAAARIGR